MRSSSTSGHVRDDHLLVSTTDAAPSSKKGGDGDVRVDRAAGGGWKSAIFIICVEIAERFAYYGIAGNLIIYLTTVLGQPVATAAKNVNTWNGVLSLALLIGAFLADSYLGRFKTTIISTTIFLMGLILLTISASHTSHHPHSSSTTLFFISLYIIAIGDGGHRPCVQTFAADQFDDDTVKEEEEKKTKSSFFNWWYLGIVIGATSSTLIVIYIQDNVNWTIGFSIPTVVEALALVIFLLGFKTYRKQRPVGSPFTLVAMVVVAAVRKWRVEEEDKNGVGVNKKVYYNDNFMVRMVDDMEEGDHCNNKQQQQQKEILAPTNQFRCLDRATIMDEIDRTTKTRNPWRLCTINQVEQVKLVLRLIPIWVCCLAFAIIVAQVHTFFIKQASTMRRNITSKFTVPPAALVAIPGFIIPICVPIYDRVFVPLIRKVTKIPTGITSLQRIGSGLGFSILTIIIAAFVESKRVSVAKQHGLIDHHMPKDHASNTIVPMSIWWLVPQFVVMGLSDFFTYVGMQELFYDQMPEDMRSLGSAFTNAAIGIGALMSSAVISIVQEISSRFGGGVDNEWLVNDLNRAHLDYFYWVLAGLGCFNLGVYVLVSKFWFVWKRSVIRGHDDHHNYNNDVA